MISSFFLNQLRFALNFNYYLLILYFFIFGLGLPATFQLCKAKTVVKRIDTSLITNHYQLRVIVYSSDVSVCVCVTERNTLALEITPMHFIIKLKYSRKGQKNYRSQTISHHIQLCHKHNRIIVFDFLTIDINLLYNDTDKMLALS